MTAIISFGGRRFELRPLKLGQLRPLLDALDGMVGRSGGALIEAAADIVVAGLGPTHPELTRDGVFGLDATLAELNAAVAAILRTAGLQPPGETPPVPGPDPAPASEPVPGAGSDSSSAPFTAPSPPVADIPVRPSTT